MYENHFSLIKASTRDDTCILGKHNGHTEQLFGKAKFQWGLFEHVNVYWNFYFQRLCQSKQIIMKPMLSK